MTKHTPGPWTFLEADYLAEASGPFTIGGGPNNDDIANVYSRENATVSISDEEAIANARLISAAPDMVEALEKVMAAYDAQSWPLENDIGLFVDTVRGALRKARGE